MKNTKELSTKKQWTLYGVMHLAMPRVKWYHLLLIIGIVPTNIAIAYFTESYIQSIAIAIWLIIPCRDKQFGNGNKYYWIRQTIFAIGTIVSLLVVVAQLVHNLIVNKMLIYGISKRKYNR